MPKPPPNEPLCERGRLAIAQDADELMSAKEQAAPLE
jgi:hypothetical protein